MDAPFLEISSSWWSKKLKKQSLLLKVIFLPCLTIAYRVFRPKYVWMWVVCIAGLKKKKWNVLAVHVGFFYSGYSQWESNDCFRRLQETIAKAISKYDYNVSVQRTLYFKLRCFTSKSIQKTLEKESEVSHKYRQLFHCQLSDVSLINANFSCLFMFWFAAVVREALK